MTDTTKPKRTRKGCEPGKTRILEPGEAPGKAGRPNEGLAREPGAPRIEGQPPSEYVDRTGRTNPGAFTSEDAKRVRVGKPYLNRDMQNLCQRYSMEKGFGSIMDIADDPDTPKRDRLNALFHINYYAWGRPRQEISMEIGAKVDGLSEAKARLDARDRARGILPAHVASPTIEVGFFAAAAREIEAAIGENGKDDGEGEE